MIPSIVMNLFDDRLMGKRRAIATVTRVIVNPAGIVFESKLVWTRATDVMVDRGGGSGMRAPYSSIRSCLPRPA